MIGSDRNYTNLDELHKPDEFDEWKTLTCGKIQKNKLPVTPK